ncbi:MAG: sensor histidine kinase [Leptospirales bacterium]
MFRTLYGKLVAILAGIFGLIGILTIILTFFSTRLYLAEVNQKLNRSLAENLVSDEVLLKNGRINPAALKDVFHMLMVINPSIEIYLLDPTGRILAYSAPKGKVKRERVSLEPVSLFLSKKATLPILGDDPRGSHRRKVFSVAPIMLDHRVAGYMYVILGGEEFDTVTHLLQNSYILRLSLWTAGASLLFAFLVGLILFRVITRRLARLAFEMDVFQKSDFSGEVAFMKRDDFFSGDEIDRLRETFHRMSDRIQQQVARLQETDRFRREMVANVSHDLRTPLTSLQGYLETLLLKEGTLSEQEKRNYLEVAVRHSKRLSVLVEELFELAKLDSQESAPHCESFSLEELVLDVVQKFQLRAEEKGIEIERDFNAGLPFVFADIQMIERVLENLIGNALQYTPEGGRITLALRCEDGKIQVRVQDTGRGIPPEDIPHIFLRFYRVEKDRSAESGGAGLGLAIVERILELHQTDIQVQSTVMTGTVFSFDLPAQNA